MIPWLPPLSDWTPHLAGGIACLIAGYAIGQRGLHRREKLVGQQRAALQCSLSELQACIEETLVGLSNRNEELRSIYDHLPDPLVAGKFAQTCQTLREQTSASLEVQHKLEDDLVHARGCIAQQAAELEPERAPARIDALSGVASRLAFDEALPLLLGRLKRGGDPFLLMLCHIDCFQWVNDQHGPSAGNKLLRDLGTVLKDCLREGDTVARYGGDEFALLLPQISLERGLRIAERLRSDAAKLSLGSDHRSQRAMTLSVGVTLAQPHDTPATIIERADQALFADKRGSREPVPCPA